MKTKKNSMNSAELLKNILDILNQLQQTSADEAQKKYFFCHKPLVVALFQGNETNGSSLFKKGESTARPLCEQDIYSYIYNFYQDENYFTDFISELQLYKSPKSIKQPPVLLDNTIEAGFKVFDVLTEIEALYENRNPYPWIEPYEFSSNIFNEYDKNNKDNLKYTDYHNRNILMLMILYLITGSVFSDARDNFRPFYNPFSNSSQKYFYLLDNSGSPEIINFLKNCIFEGVNNIYIIPKTAKSNTDIIEAIHPSGRFWIKYNDQKEKIHLPACNPFFDADFTLEKYISENDLIIFESGITPTINTQIKSLNCKVLEIVETYPRNIDDTTIFTFNDFLDDWLSYSTKHNKTRTNFSSVELESFRKLYSKIGSNPEMYYIFHRYYSCGEKEKTTSGEKLLVDLIAATRLTDITDVLKNHKQKVSLKINGRSSGINLLNAISKLYASDINSSKTSFNVEEAEMLRFVYQINEINPSIPIKDICYLYNYKELYEKLVDLGWVGKDSCKIPATVVAGLTYNPNMPNELSSSYINKFIYQTIFFLLGYDVEYIQPELLHTIIQCIQEEQYSYFEKRTKKSLEDLRKGYFIKFDKIGCNDISFDDLFNARTTGILPITSDKTSAQKRHEDNIKHPYQPFHFGHSQIMDWFYYSTLVFYHEIKRFDLAKSFITKMPPKHSTNSDYQLYYELLFNQSHLTETIDSLHKVIVEYYQKTISDPSKKNQFESTKPLVFALLRCLITAFHHFPLFQELTEEMQLQYRHYINISLHIIQIINLYVKTPPVSREIDIIRLYIDIFHRGIKKITTTLPIPEADDDSIFYKYHKNYHDKVMAALCNIKS